MLRMKRKFSEYSLTDLLLIGLPALLLLGGGFWLASRFIQPAPPHVLVLSSGGEGGAYQLFSARYKAILARNYIELKELPSPGAVENLRRLRDEQSPVDVAFLQGGVGMGQDTAGLVSLGSLYPEPLWVFYRGQENVERLLQLRGKRIGVGAEGSGTRKLAQEMLEAEGIATAPTRLLPVSGLEAVAALQKGEVDAVFLVGGAQSGAVWSLLFSEGVKLMSFARADAYARRYPFLEKVVLPAGAIDLARDLPARDVTLVAPIATLVAREDTHPALINLLLQAAAEVHAEPGLFQKPRQFPNATAVDFPLSPEASRFYTSGKPFLQRYLPFWLATFIDRMLVMLIPLLALALPLVKLAPVLYGWRIRSRIFRCYGELKFLEAELEAEGARQGAPAWLERLERVERVANAIRTPQAFMDQLYTLRGHIDLVRHKLERRSARAAAVVKD